MAVAEDEFDFGAGILPGVGRIHALGGEFLLHEIFRDITLVFMGLLFALRIAEVEHTAEQAHIKQA